MFIFGGVDKNQKRFSELHEFVIENRHWTQVKATGTIPSARTFHQTVLLQKAMIVVGGFDGNRLNDIYSIKLKGSDIPPQSTRMLRTVPSDMPIHNNQEEDKNPSQLKEDNQKLKKQVAELQERLSQEEQRDLCRICYSQDIDCVLLDCAHRFICMECAKQFQNCPICRQKIRSTIQTFSPY